MVKIKTSLMFELYKLQLMKKSYSSRIKQLSKDLKKFKCSLKNSRTRIKDFHDLVKFNVNDRTSKIPQPYCIRANLLAELNEYIKSCHADLDTHELQFNRFIKKSSSLIRLKSFKKVPIQNISNEFKQISVLGSHISIQNGRLKLLESNYQGINLIFGISLRKREVSAKFIYSNKNIIHPNEINALNLSKFIPNRPTKIQVRLLLEKVVTFVYTLDNDLYGYLVEPGLGKSYLLEKNCTEFMFEILGPYYYIYCPESQSVLKLDMFSLPKIEKFKIDKLDSFMVTIDYFIGRCNENGKQMLKFYDPKTLSLKLKIPFESINMPLRIDTMFSSLDYYYFQEDNKIYVMSQLAYKIIKRIKLPDGLVVLKITDNNVIVATNEEKSKIFFIDYDGKIRQEQKLQDFGQHVYIFCNNDLKLYFFDQNRLKFFQLNQFVMRINTS